MPVHRISIKNYERMKRDNRIGPQQRIVIMALYQSENPLTRTELSYATGLPINVITGRVNEMVKLNFISECGERKCTITGMKVSVIKVNKKEYFKNKTE